MAKQAVLKIYGDIGEPDNSMIFFELEDTSTVSSADVSAFIDDNQDADELVVKINSRGGDVQEGWAIYDLLTTCGKKITTIGEGKVYSIATVIFLAGSERKMLKNADGLIHLPFIPPYTLADAYESGDLIKIAESLKQEEQKILNLYVERTGGDEAKIAKYMEDETKLSAEDMLALGFATKIIEPVKAYAYFKYESKTKNGVMKPTEKEKQTLMERFKALMDGDLAKAFSRLADEIVAQEFTDAAGNKFNLEKEQGAPVVGDVASPDGTYTMENGDVIVIANGKIESITTAAAPGDELAKAKAEIERLKGELAQANAKATQEANKANALVEEKKTLDESLQAFKAKENEVVSLIKDLRALQNSWKPESRSQGSEGKNMVDGVNLDRVNEILEAQKQ